MLPVRTTVPSNVTTTAMPGASSPKADSCPDCGGSGYYYPEGVEKGVKICKHEKLKGAV